MHNDDQNVPNQNNRDENINGMEFGINLKTGKRKSETMNIIL